MFGYATNETENCMPLTIHLAHELNRKMAELRRSGECAWLRPGTISLYIIIIIKHTGGPIRNTF